VDSTDFLASEYLRHEQLYRAGLAEISDFEFDALQSKLIEASPDHPVLRVVESGRKLLSLGNQPVESWLEKIPASVELAVQPKIDGVAIALRYVDGVIARAWTRKGEDKTRNVLEADNIPPQLPIKKTVEIRGELYAPNIDAARSQRIAAGLLRKKDPRHVSGISFCAFEILNCDPEIYPDEAHILDYLKEWGFQTPPTTSVSGLSDIKEIHNKWLDGRFFNTEFPSDGIVVKIVDRYQQKVMGVSSVAPNWALAIKELWKTN
tara:strand:+ start:2277 stop:3065 length:789 start_codon:yes stop_codon:yes gene_type:complete